MSVNRVRLPGLWPWLLIVALLAAGPLLASCGSNAASATPTPTKTPRAEAAAATETTEVAAATELPPATVPPPATSAPTDTPASEPAAGPSPTPVPPTPTTTPPTATPVVHRGDLMTSPDYGIQAFLWWRPEVADRDLGLIQDAGFNWVKQLFSWQDIEGAGKGQYDWTYADRVVDQVQEHHLKLIVRISQDPDRPFWAGNPPDNAGHYAEFLAAVARRYAGRIQAYQIWNEPNLGREWGGKRPDPAGYARMLKAAYKAIKDIDPNALVVTAGMAPTGTDTNEAMPDIKFYEQFYQAMGGNSDGYFDLLGAHAAGYAAAPEISPDETAANKAKYGGERFFAFRHVEDVRAVMERNGDRNKRIAILEFGWTTDNRPDSPYYWHGAGAGITEEIKGRYLVQALEYARAHWTPWIGLMTVIYMPDVDWTKNTEQFYWSVIGPGYPELNLRPAYVMLCAYLNDLRGQRCPYVPPE